jgi:hypothetical protein
MEEIHELLYGKNARRDDGDDDDDDGDGNGNDEEEEEEEEEEGEEGGYDERADECYSGLKIEGNNWTLRDIIYEISEGGFVLAPASEGFSDM